MYFSWYLKGLLLEWHVYFASLFRMSAKKMTFDPISDSLKMGKFGIFLC